MQRLLQVNEYENEWYDKGLACLGLKRWHAGPRKTTVRRSRVVKPRSSQGYGFCCICSTNSVDRRVQIVL